MVRPLPSMLSMLRFLSIVGEGAGRERDGRQGSKEVEDVRRKKITQFISSLAKVNQVRGQRIQGNKI